jgi:hypothetical protein
MSEKTPEKDWLNSKWRPMMGWTYMITCITDFIIFPILWSIFKAHIGESVEPWSPLTLQGAGLYHVAMGAVLGVAAWTRGQEKITAMNHGYGSNYNNTYGYEYERNYEYAQPVQDRKPLRNRNHPPPKTMPLDDDEMPPRE